jgi:hypothetical protein
MNELRKPTENIFNAIEEQIKQIELDVPDSLKMGILINCLHGIHVQRLLRTKLGSIEAIYGPISDTLVFERDMLCDAITRIESLKQSEQN